jgi:hypothetical protein
MSSEIEDATGFVMVGGTIGAGGVGVAGGKGVAGGADVAGVVGAGEGASEGPEKVTGTSGTALVLSITSFDATSFAFVEL